MCVCIISGSSCDSCVISCQHKLFSNLLAMHTFQELVHVSLGHRHCKEVPDMGSSSWRSAKGIDSVPVTGQMAVFILLSVVTLQMPHTLSLLAFGVSLNYNTEE